jgi:Fic family protein
MNTYLRKQKEWPYLTWDDKELSSVLGEVRNRQGLLTGKVSLLGLDLKHKALLDTLTMDILQSVALEGVYLNEPQVRTSVARHLHIRIANGVEYNPVIDAVVQTAMDVLTNYRQPIDEGRIFRWKRAFGALYEEAEGHSPSAEVQYPNTPDALRIEGEMNRFIRWFNTVHQTDPVIKAGVALLRLILIRPFEKENGPMARTLADLLLTRADNSPFRFFSLSAQLFKQKENYHRMLKKAQNGSPDITEWLTWFLYCLYTALTEAESLLTHVVAKSKFWEKYRLIRLNDRQVKMINLLWDGIDANLTSSYWAKLNACSSDTALRDIQDLIKKQILCKKNRGGRSTAYELI